MTNENDEVRQFVESTLSRDEARSEAERLGFDELTPEAYRSVALDMTDSRIQNQMEYGWDRVSAVERVFNDLPNSLTDSVIQSERGIFPHDGEYPSLEDHLRLEQLAAENGQDTRETRKDLWDRLLAFSHYRATIQYESSTGDERSHQYDFMGKSNAKAHNKILREFQDRNPNSEVKSIDTKVRKLASPELDPLPDLEEFVYRF